MSQATTPIPAPVVSATGYSVTHGAPVSKMARLSILSPAEWEEVVQEWAYSALKSIHNYSDVHRAGSAGDMGRDVIGYLGSVDGDYDNYQCKHYDHALYPGDIWLEIGKLCYWTFKKAYKLPRAYRFVAPQGVGTSLLRLLEDPAELKKKFLEKWDTDCADKIVGGQSIPLSDELKAHIQGIEFKIFGAVAPVKLIEEHATTTFHIPRFGGGLPSFNDDSKPPATITSVESRYIRQLLDVYEEKAGCTVVAVEDLDGIDKSLAKHLNDSREEFFSAECLDKFTRDNLPPGCFERLQEDIEDSVREVMEEEYDCGLSRVKATTKQAKLTPVDGHPLYGNVRPRAKAGICHQLANMDRLIWLPGGS